MLIQYQAILKESVMSTEPLYLIHLTDTHVKAPSARQFLNLDSTARLRAVFAAVRDLSLKPACFLISGDLAHEGTRADYVHLKAVLDEEAAGFGVPMLVALGNHDDRSAFREGFLGEAPSSNGYYYASLVDGLRVITLDSEITAAGEKVEGWLDAVQLSWLQEQLQTTAPRGTLIMLHHPPLRSTYRLFDDRVLNNPDDLGAVIRGSDVIGILSGHIHFTSVGVFEGVPSVASAGVSFNIDPTTPRSMRFIDSSGYNLVMIREGRMIAQPLMLPGTNRELLHWQIGERFQRKAEQNPDELPPELR